MTLFDLEMAALRAGFRFGADSGIQAQMGPN
jgi:hypothetical protein